MRALVEPAAVGGVMAREWVMYRRYWASTTVSSIVEPLMYLLAFGFGFGALVSQVAGYDYVVFVGTGVVATAVLFSSAFPGMFATFVKRTFQRTYDAMLAAPVDTEDLVTAEALFLALKSGAYGLAPLAVAVGFGLDPSPGMLLVPFIGTLTGFGFACFGIWCSAIVPSINSFNYVISIVLTPVFLVAGTFFPLEGLPGWAQALARLNPLHHCVELVRHAVFGLEPLADLGSVALLGVFGAVMWLVAVRALRTKLVQ
ncbi:MAG: ABC transporter permease [Actinomycetota bacterium]|nr:ABC transporter permease [Actinomycetota bacterium]